MVLEYASLATGILAAGFLFNSGRWWDLFSSETELSRTTRFIALVAMCFTEWGASGLFGHPRSVQAVGAAALVIWIPQLLISWVWLVMLPPGRRQQR